MESEILKKISSSGLIGTKRIEIKKTFGKNCEKILKGLIEKQEIIVEKKGNAYFVWTKENYISQRSQNDPKFILALRIATKSNNTKSEETNHIRNVQNTIQVSHQI